jgi:hypothetical protein
MFAMSCHYVCVLGNFLELGHVKFVLDSVSEY